MQSKGYTLAYNPLCLIIIYCMISKYYFGYFEKKNDLLSLKIN